MWKNILRYYLGIHIVGFRKITNNPVPGLRFEPRTGQEAGYCQIESDMCAI
jgi:hypothetical protein